MFDVIKTRIAQGYRTGTYPKTPPALPELFKGLPVITGADCGKDCTACVNACPVNAIRKGDNGVVLDMGRCIFCGACERACSNGCITFSKEHSLARRNRGDLLIDGSTVPQKAAPLEPERLKLFKRSIHLRQVSAGGCNACEADINVLNTLVFDLARFGIKFVASPRHADGVVVTGPVTKNMELALMKTYDAVPAPKVVIAVGACGVSGGMFAGGDQVHRGVEELLPVDMYIPGCPPHPYTILDGFLRLLGKIK